MLSTGLFPIFPALLLLHLPDIRSERAGPIISSNTEYMCWPCGNSCDNDVYDKPGNCRHCGMALVEKAKISFANVSPNDVCGIVNGNKAVVLLDARTPEEYRGQDRGKYGHLKNAINIPIGELEKRISELEPYKNREIIVYCSHSQRSPRASLLLTQKGFRNVKNMSGGLSTWHHSVQNAGCRTSLLVKE